jgi:hypothetical protein
VATQLAHEIFDGLHVRAHLVIVRLEPLKVTLHSLEVLAGVECLKGFERVWEVERKILSIRVFELLPRVSLRVLAERIFLAISCT